jgi:hypothetical protein
MKGEGSKTVAKRISLVEGLKRDHETLDPVAVENFVKLGKAQPEHDTEPETPPRLQLSPTTEERRSTPVAKKPKGAAVMAPGLIPVNVRVRPDIATALQTASLERQLQGLEPSSKREIVEEALEPWLRSNGYLS